LKTGLLADRQHPTQGAAAAQLRARLVREDVFEALVSILGRDLILSKVAEAHGEDRALAVADVLGLNAAGWLDERTARQKQTTQTSLKVNPSASYDYDYEHSPEFMDVLIRGGSAADLQAARETAQRRIDAERASRKTTGPGNKPEPTQPPVQRTLRHTSPDAQFNADDPAQPSTTRPVSAPPMIASSREDA